MKDTRSLENAAFSIRLSRGLVFLFAFALAALDLLSLLTCFGSVYESLHYPKEILTLGEMRLLTVCIFLCSLPGYLLLADMNRLLVNLQQGLVFDGRNVALLQRVSRCCFAASFCCLVFAWKLPTLAAITLAAGFVGLIVRIVRNVFEQAILMKDELDLTV